MKLFFDNLSSLSSKILLCKKEVSLNMMLLNKAVKINQLNVDAAQNEVAG